MQRCSRHTCLLMTCVFCHRTTSFLFRQIFGTLKANCVKDFLTFEQLMNGLMFPHWGIFVLVTEHDYKETTILQMLAWFFIQNFVSFFILRFDRNSCTRTIKDLLDFLGFIATISLLIGCYTIMLGLPCFIHWSLCSMDCLVYFLPRITLLPFLGLLLVFAFS